MLQKIVLIAAGGVGSRLQSNLPKQYMPLNGLPVLMHTINQFVGLVDKIIIAIHPDMFDQWNELCIKHNFTIKHEIVFGGKTRFQSIKNALGYLYENYNTELIEKTAIAIHDAARPLIDQDLISKSFDLAVNGQSNVVATKSVNSIRLGGKEQSKSIDRNQVWQMQTPQTFPSYILQEAYQQEESDLFTDDASVVETIGYPITLLEGNQKNIKITFPEDFEIAKIYLKN